MARRITFGPKMMVVPLLLLSVIIMATSAIADTGAKNNGIVAESKAAIFNKNNGVKGDITKALPAGTRVKAVVDYPSGSDCIRSGYLGTIKCYDPNDPVLPYLVDWDNPCGYEQCQVCSVCATHGWWVGADEIVQAGGQSTVIPTGSRVKAVVDYPSGSDCIRSGYLGTLVCYDPNDAELPYLVDWDNACGFEQCQVCGVCATHGWWVGFDEIVKAGGGGSHSISGCIELDGQPVVSRRVLLKQTGETTKTTRTDSAGCYEFTNPAVGKTFKVIIRGPKVRR